MSLRVVGGSWGDGSRRAPVLPVTQPAPRPTAAERVSNWMWPLPRHRVDVPTFLAEARTGDILLWGNRDLRGLWVRFWTWSPFTHVSSVYLNPETGIPYQFQSTTHVNDGDALTGEFDREGVQLNPLESSAKRYLREYGCLCWRPLLWRNADGVYVREAPPKAVEILNRGYTTVMNQTRGYGFQGHWNQMMGGRAPFLQFCPKPVGYVPHFENRIYCAALVGLTLRHAKVLRPTWPIWNYSPESFNDVRPQMPLEPAWGYGPTQEVVLRGA